MTRRHFRLPAFLRASLLVLLALGVAVKPMLTHVGELHAVEHASLADPDGHGHGHDDGQDDEPGTDHTEGTHGLMHQAGTGGAFNDVAGVIAISAIAGRSQLLPPPDIARVPTQHAATPFRPPIA